MNIEQAKNLLDEHQASCLIFKNQQLIYSSQYIGVKPLLQFIKEKHLMNKTDELILVDKVIGKAAMLLAAYIGVTHVLTPVMSEEAVKVAELYHIDYEALTMVPYIINRQSTGKCPLELSVAATEDKEKAIVNIQEAVAELMKMRS